MALWSRWAAFRPVGRLSAGSLNLSGVLWLSFRVVYPAVGRCRPAWEPDRVQRRFQYQADWGADWLVFRWIPGCLFPTGGRSAGGMVLFRGVFGGSAVGRRISRCGAFCDGSSRGVAQVGMLRLPGISPGIFPVDWRLPGGGGSSGSLPERLYFALRSVLRGLTVVLCPFFLLCRAWGCFRSGVVFGVLAVLGRRFYPLLSRTSLARSMIL